MKKWENNLHIGPTGLFSHQTTFSIFFFRLVLLFVVHFFSRVSVDRLISHVFSTILCATFRNIDKLYITAELNFPQSTKIIITYLYVFLFLRFHYYYNLQISNNVSGVSALCDEHLMIPLTSKPHDVFDSGALLTTNKVRTRNEKKNRLPKPSPKWKNTTTARKTKAAQNQEEPIRNWEIVS